MARTGVFKYLNISFAFYFIVIGNSISVHIFPIIAGFHVYILMKTRADLNKFYTVPGKISKN
jgi:hypothetical protein